MSFIRRTNGFFSSAYKPLQNMHEIKRFSGEKSFLKNGLSTFLQKQEEELPKITAPIKISVSEKEIVPFPSTSHLQNEINQKKINLEPKKIGIRVLKKIRVLQNWINQAKGTPEFEARIEAAKRMVTCKRYGQQTLDLRGMGLTSVCGLDFSSFHTVNLEGNQITSLKNVRLPRVQFFASYNKITDIEGTDFSHLHEVVLNYNRITSLEGVRFPDGAFSATNNQITDIKGIDFSNAHWVYLNYNQITSLEGVRRPKWEFHIVGNEISNDKGKRTQYFEHTKSIISKKAQDILQLVKKLRY